MPHFRLNMPKELLLYGVINDQSSIDFITAMNQISASEGMKVRVNTPGGDPAYTWGMVTKYSEYTGKKIVIVDGQAYSGGFFFATYADEVEAVDFANFLLHRAAYPSWIENSPEIFTEALRGNLMRINASLQKAVEAKIDVEKLHAIMDSRPETKGKTIDDIFSMDDRLDVFLTAKEAKKIGLINRIISITPQKKVEIETKMSEVSDKYNSLRPAAKKDNPLNDTIMTLAELKAQFPGVYNELFNAGHAAGLATGIAQEKDRVEAALVFIEIDPAGVKASIESGKPLSAKQMAEFSLKSMSPEVLKKLEKEAPNATKTGAVVEAKAKTPEELALEAFEKELDQSLKLDPAK